MKNIRSLVLFALAIITFSCSNGHDFESTDLYPNVTAKFAATIDLNNPSNYANQGKPTYINKDNTAGNPITDKGATLGRVLKYYVHKTQWNQFL